MDSNNWQGAYDATNYLLSLGHTRIAFITGFMALHSARQRLKGYKAALNAHGISPDERIIIKAGFTQTAGYNATCQLLESVGGTDRPTAIFASNDLSAIGVMEAVREQGLSIPEDISVIGFDDISQASITYPKLTTVRQPLADMGKVAVQLLLERIKTPDTPIVHKTLTTSLVIRDSCAAPKCIEAT